MSFAIAPVLTTPLLKVPLLLTTAAYTYYGLTPPASDPEAQEVERFSAVAPDLISRKFNYHLPVIVCVKASTSSTRDPLP